MKQPTFCGRELLPLSVIEAARAGDPLAVERVLWYYEGYMDKLCRSICLAALRRQAACRSHGPVPAWPRRGQRIGSGGGPDCCLSGSPAPAAFQILCPLFHRSSQRRTPAFCPRSCPGSRCSPTPFSALT